MFIFGHQKSLFEWNPPSSTRQAAPADSWQVAKLVLTAGELSGFTGAHAAHAPAPGPLTVSPHAAHAPAPGTLTVGALCSLVNYLDFSMFTVLNLTRIQNQGCQKM